LIFATKSGKIIVFCGRNSMAECQLPKLKVASSTLVARFLLTDKTNRTVDCGKIARKNGAFLRANLTKRPQIVFNISFVSGWNSKQKETKKEGV
jgi:hypothetical protein